MENKRLTYEEVNRIELNYYDEPQKLSDGYYAIGISTDGKYRVDVYFPTSDQRVVELSTNMEVWSYYNDFYDGRS